MLTATAVRLTRTITRSALRKEPPCRGPHTLALRGGQVMRFTVTALLVAAAAAQTGATTSYEATASYSDTSCSDGCPDEWVGDGMCDTSCNVEACKYDGRGC